MRPTRVVSGWPGRRTAPARNACPGRAGEAHRPRELRLKTRSSPQGLTECCGRGDLDGETGSARPDTTPIRMFESAWPCFVGLRPASTHLVRAGSRSEAPWSGFCGQVVELPARPAGKRTGASLPARTRTPAKGRPPNRIGPGPVLRSDPHEWQDSEAGRYHDCDAMSRAKLTDGHFIERCITGSVRTTVSMTSPSSRRRRGSDCHQWARADALDHQALTVDARRDGRATPRPPSWRQADPGSSRRRTCAWWALLLGGLRGARPMTRK
jgi:hypothetical protein